MLSDMSCLKLCSIAFILTTGFNQVLAQGTYRPGIGDHVEVFRRAFGTRNHSKGRAALLQTLKANEDRDGLVRMTVVAENAATGEVVTLEFSDPYNRGNWKYKSALAHLKKLETRPPLRHSFSIFEILDEGVSIKSGDTLKLYWHQVKPDAHNSMKEALAERMMKSLQKDKYKANGYFCESETAGMLLGIGFGGFAPTPGVHAHAYSHLKASIASPVKRESYRVIWVRVEKRK